jgi:hypothetical protein
MAKKLRVKELAGPHRKDPQRPLSWAGIAGPFKMHDKNVLLSL